MTNKTITVWEQTRTLFSQHWFKIGLVVLSLYAFLSRDFSLAISIEAPKEVPASDQFLQPTSKRETLTDNSLSAPQTTNHFDLLPSWGDGNSINYLQILQSKEQQEIGEFIQRFSHVAAAEQEKYGVPTSITLAHALLKSSAGTAEFTKAGHNYFALACSDNWDGGTQDGRQGCIRRYDNAWQSFRDHSLFLTTGKNVSLKKIPSTNLSTWAAALDQVFEDDDDLDEQLLFVIEKFGL